MTHQADSKSAGLTSASNRELEDQERYQATRNATVIGALVNTILAVTKISVGYLGQSQALIADGLHSLSDLASDIAIIFAAKQGSRAADENHPYGHGRIETLFTVFLGLFLIIVAAGILIDSLFRMLDPDKLLQPGFAAMGVALFSVLANEALYQYTHRVATRISSKLLEANAWHHRTDGISSIIVLIGVGGSMMGIRYLDALAAVGMALMIIKIGWRICLESTQELVDTGLSPDRITQITDKINAVAGVEHMHTLRTRRVGNVAFVDVHIQVAPKLSVSEGHFISEQVRIALVEHITDIGDVTVHIDPEDDEVPNYDTQMPDRQTLLRQLHKNWSNVTQSELIKEINLHYLDGQIHIELLCPLDQFEDLQRAQTLAAEIQKKNQGLPFVASTKLIFYIE